MKPVYLLTLRQLSGRWRLLIMTILAAMPVFITLMILRGDSAGTVEGFEKDVLSTMFAGSIIPLVVLAIGSVAFGNELEDRTLANLTLAPLPRWQIVVPKLLGAITVAAPFVAASAFATSYLAFLGDAQAVIAVTTAALAAVALYAAFFVWLGLVSTQAIGMGLLYTILWEGVFSGYVSGVRLFSIRHYSIALMHGLDARRFASDDHLSLLAAALISSLVFAGFAWLTVRKLRRMDVP